MDDLFSFETIAEFHNFCKLPRPVHPLISVVDYKHFSAQLVGDEDSVWQHSYYTICLKKYSGGNYKYGKNDFHFDTGRLSFFSPNQCLKMEGNRQDLGTATGSLLLIHPDFFCNTPLAEKITTYDYFKYAINEALFLSEQEETVIIDILKSISGEYESNIDKFSQGLIVSKIENLLIYAERFYERQFYTQSKTNNELLDRFEVLLSQYFEDDKLEEKGLPKVSEIAEQLHISSNYLGSVLRLFTHQSTQQHIQNKIIELAKIKLSTTHLTISEIAYELGFEHSQSFNRLFKRKTEQTPLEFRASFN
ncbi:Helix-turn-helix domain-containing protein [Gillisia sp. Hel1_33_143]|uniref:helix-turn-helix domain-containing protein n=1 Tax=Gillisia sp. Hel1_33_143 TaxID=1336796 RepID=UPI00087CEF8A|nr:helix-turn-helix transcriptional regulator [Gillisia sp. Hel1_33_143]SDR99324.1 Helix-turn-helix domain-containing protein [Gillisia sp. Hel1_33_143]